MARLFIVRRGGFKRRQRRPYSIFGSGAAVTTLTAEQGSFTLAGQDTLFQVQFVAGHGSFVLTGQAAIFEVQFVVGQGSFALSGQSVSFTPTEAAGEGLFVLSGQDTAFQVGFSVEHGSFALSGQSAAFSTNISVEFGSFALTGQSAAFQTQVGVGHGQFVVTGGELNTSPAVLDFSHDRGFEETLEAFAIQRRREKEEREIGELLAFEASMIAKALLPFVAGHNAPRGRG
jgi:hypothetical protein